MPQIAAQFPGQQVSNDLYNALDFGGWDQRNQQFNSAMQNDQLNRRASLQDILFNDQHNPIKLRQAGLNADTTEAQLPGVRGDSQVKSVNGRIAAATEEDVLKTKRADLAKSISEDELKTLVNRAHVFRLQAKTPQEKHIAEIIWGQLSDVKLEREKLRSQEAIHKGNNDTSRYVADVGARSRETVAATNAAGKGGGARNFLGSLDKMKKASEKFAALHTEATRIEQENPDAAELYRRMAESIRPAAEAELKTDPKAGGVDLSQLPGRGLVTQPSKAIAPQNNPAAKSPTPSTATDPIRKAVIQAGGVYEPDKYEYRITPDGRVQKRAK